MRFKAVFLDAINTIWYVKRSPTQIWYELLSEMDEGHSLEQIRAAEQKEQRELLERWDLLETSGRPNDLAVIDAIWEDYDTKVLNHLGLSVDRNTLKSELIPRFANMLALFDETLEVLEALRNQGYRMAIVSNGMYQESAAKQFGIDIYFDYVIGSMHVGVRKPMPQIFQMALKSLDVLPEEAVMVGDDWQADIMGARGVGIRGIHINRGLEPSPPGEHSSTDDLRGVVALLHGESIQ